MLLKRGRKTMKKAIWILFIFAALVWTAFAFAASGLARWTSDAIAAAPNSSSSWATATETATTAVTAPVNDAVGAATAAISKLGASVPPLPALPPMPAMPPVPEWVNQWLGPEWTQSLREWGAWAKAAAGSPQTANVPNSATTTAPAATASSETSSNTAAAATQAATQAASVKATQLAEQARSTAVAASPWLASMVGWLVPIVWVLWGIGLLVGFVSTLVLQWLVGRMSGGGSNGGSGMPARSFS
jgi:hypothetical protein